MLLQPKQATLWSAWLRFVWTCCMLEPTSAKGKCCCDFVFLYRDNHDFCPSSDNYTHSSSIYVMLWSERRVNDFRVCCWLNSSLSFQMYSVNWQVSHETDKRQWQRDQLSKWWSRHRVCRVEMGKTGRSHRAGVLQWLLSRLICCFFPRMLLFQKLISKRNHWQAVDYKRPQYEEVMKTFEPYLNGSGISAKCKSTKWWNFRLHG